MSPYFIKEVHFVDGLLVITIGDANNDNWVVKISPCADELLNAFSGK